MAATTVEDILNGANYAHDPGSLKKGKKVTYDSDAMNSDYDSGDFLDGVMKNAKFINAQALSLYNYDCSDHLIEWMYSVCPGLKTVGSKIDSITSKLNSVTTGVKIGDLVRDNAFTKQVCHVVEVFFAMMNAWLESLSKAAFALFDKIDAARERMQTALKSITDAVLECILDVYDMIEKYLGRILKVSLEFKWDDLEIFLRDCPCICRFVAYLTNCDYDDNGNSISDNPSAVVRCIREKYWFLEGANLAGALSAVMDTYIKQYVVLMFDAIKLAIDSIFTLFIKPFRYLIKQYADFLRKKWDVGFMIEPAKTSHLDCLFVYNKETKNGSTVYTMSIIDMMSTMKMWVGCLEYPCAALSEKIKNRVKKYHEDFRLTGEFWNREYEADIYLCCMRADEDNTYSLEDLAKMWGSLLDRLRACNEKAKKGVDLARFRFGLDGTVGIQDSVRSVREATAPASSPAGTAAASVGESAGAWNDASKYESAPEQENDINAGSRPLTEHEDKLIRSMGEGIYTGGETDPYFTEKWFQYLRFISLYRVSDGTLEALNGLLTGYGRDGFNNPPPGTIQFTNGRKELEMDETERPANYWVDSDYDAERVAAIESVEFTGRNDGETLADYYGRLYAAV